MMKKIFIYYSLTGNGDVIGDYLKDKGIEVRKVITKEELPKSFVLRIMSGGYKAMIQYKDKLDGFNADISNYDEVIIGSPIWNSRLSSPINSVLDKLKLEGKRVTFILYSGSGESKGASKRIKKEYPSAKIIDIKNPLNNKEDMVSKLENCWN